jgi:hypothetical protein
MVKGSTFKTNLARSLGYRFPLLSFLLYYDFLRKGFRRMIEGTLVETLTRWKDFYVIVGSSAGALTGLQFVTMTLIAESRLSDMRAVRAFGSPTVVHFCIALLVSALASCPWDTLLPAAVALGCCGIGGLAYLLMAIRHARKQTSYKPDWEDWMWYAWLPLVAYASLALGGIMVAKTPTSGLFVVAAVCLVLLFIGIHNSWDSVTYLAVNHHGKTGKEKGTD